MKGVSSIFCYSGSNRKSLTWYTIKKQYASVQIVFTIANDVFSSSTAWSVPLFAVIGAAMGNCTFTLAAGENILKKMGFTILLLYSFIATAAIYFTFCQHERVFDNSCRILNAFYPGGGLFKKRLRRRWQQRRYRRPNRHWKQRPLAVNIGIFFRAEHGCARDFVQTVVQATFNALVLY